MRKPIEAPTEELVLLRYLVNYFDPKVKQPYECDCCGRFVVKEKRKGLGYYCGICLSVCDFAVSDGALPREIRRTVHRFLNFELRDA